MYIYRLSVSDYREHFFLKGGALLYAHDKFEARPTLDIDLDPQDLARAASRKNSKGDGRGELVPEFRGKKRKPG